MDKPKLINLEMHLMHAYGLTFDGPPDPLAPPVPVESCIEMRLRVTGPPHSIFELYAALEKVQGVEVIERLVSGLGNSSSARYGVAGHRWRGLELECLVRLDDGRDCPYSLEQHRAA
jgi:hypothetical protein